MEKKDLKPGDVLLCPPLPLPGGWIGQSIVALTKGKVSHSGIYCEKEGKPQVAHSNLKGIILTPSDDFIHHMRSCYVLREKNMDLTPVLEAVEGYAGKGVPYPAQDFVILGLLILISRLSPDTVRARKFYEFAKLVSVKIIDKINSRILSEKSMSCSQFVSQCYTDAGEEYDIRFKKLLLDFGGLNSAGDELSLFSLLDPDKELEERDLLAVNLMPEEEAALAEDFISLINGNGNENDMLDSVSSKKQEEIAQELLITVCQYITHKKPTTVGEAMSILSTNRNYFVLPDDLLSNSENLEKMGYIKVR